MAAPPRPVVGAEKRAHEARRDPPRDSGHRGGGGAQDASRDAEHGRDRARHKPSMSAAEKEAKLRQMQEDANEHESER